MNSNLDREKRSQARVRFDAPATVEPVPVPAPKHRWRVLGEDISEDGMRLSSPKLFPVTSHLLLDIDLGIPTAPIRAIGRVVWAGQLAHVDRWEIGVEFSELSDEARSRLRKILTCHHRARVIGARHKTERRGVLQPSTGNLGSPRGMTRTPTHIPG